jgi:hypothetical protein
VPPTYQGPTYQARAGDYAGPIARVRVQAGCGIAVTQRLRGPSIRYNSRLLGCRDGLWDRPQPERCGQMSAQTRAARRRGMLAQTHKADLCPVRNWA